MDKKDINYLVDINLLKRKNERLINENELLKKANEEKYKLKKRCEVVEELLWNYYFKKKGAVKAIEDHIKKNLVSLIRTKK